jgi:hypothetical protein
MSFQKAKNLSFRLKAIRNMVYAERYFVLMVKIPTEKRINLNWFKKSLRCYEK